MTGSERRRFTRLVVDTTPLLSGVITTDLADHLYTTSGVLSEIKDKATKERLAATILPAITVKEPCAEADRLCVEAAKRSGDMASLSRTDLGLVALLVTLDMETNPGKTYTVSEPILMSRSGDEKDGNEKTEITNQHDDDNTCHNDHTSHDDHTSNSNQNDNEPEWINADNMESQLSKDTKITQPQPTVDLACTSGDRAVQNLILSLRLRAYDADLKRIKQQKSFLLRCHACGWTTPVVDGDKFCDGCGSPCLMRCTFTIGRDGKKRLWLKAGMTYNLRGTIYSLPRPQGGRHADQLVLRKDQREYQRALHRADLAEAKLRKATEGMDDLDDRLAAIFGDMQVKGSSGRGGGKHSQQAGKAVIGHGRRNPNEVRR